jgi:hypothetical protein
LPNTASKNSKWTKDLNVKTETIKLLEENIEGKLHGIRLSIDFFGMPPKAQATKENRQVFKTCTH